MSSKLFLQSLSAEIEDGSKCTEDNQYNDESNDSAAWGGNLWPIAWVNIFLQQICDVGRADILDQNDLSCLIGSDN